MYAMWARFRAHVLVANVTSTGSIKGRLSRFAGDIKVPMTDCEVFYPDVSVVGGGRNS